MNNTVQYNITDLGILQCYFLEIPQTKIEAGCSVSNPHLCIVCPIIGAYLAGGNITSYGATGIGHKISLFLWTATVIFGIIGVFSNLIIIGVISRKSGTSRRSFDLMLISLALSDLFASIFSIAAATGTISLLEFWDRGYWSHLLFCIGGPACLAGRTTSAFLTIAITVERYLVIAHPFRSKNWFQTKYTLILIFLVYLLTTGLISMPRFVSYKVSHNFEFNDVPSLETFSYLITSTSAEQFWYHDAKGYFLKIDFWAPLPILLVLNILLYHEIYKGLAEGDQINVVRNKEIRVARRFLPVILFLFASHTVPVIFYYYLTVDGVGYRELLIGTFLSAAVNSAINLPLYFINGTRFRRQLIESFRRNKMTRTLSQRA